jgi:hypothetical protein
MSAARDVTFRDAGLHSRPLQILNAVGAGLARLGFLRPRLEPEALLAAARTSAGSDDFGADTFREPLAVLCEATLREAGLSTFGRIAMRGLLVETLANRLRLLDWAKRHPEVREERISRPWVVVGLPRTGTTLLSDLLGLDPGVRPLRQWEAGSPVPPPDLAGHLEDPRIAKSARSLAQLHRINPAIRAMHPMGATLPTECVVLFNLDLRSWLLETQAFVPSYGRWLERADVTHAYALHRLALQVLQSRIPTETWSLKTPQHLFHLDALRAEYPDARIVWTHRDPHKVIPSVASINCALQRPLARATDPVAVGSYWDHTMHLAVSRGMDFDARQGGRAWCHHLRYADLMADPIPAMRRLYAHFGLEISALHEARMRAWLRQRPQDTFGRHRYDPADFGFRPGDIDARYADYRKRFDVPRETSA